MFMGTYCKDNLSCEVIKGRSFWLFPLILLTLSCSKSDDLIDWEEAKEEFPIVWSVTTSNETKALVNDYQTLRDLCTTSESQPAEKIGLFGSYTLEDNKVTIFDNVDLWWWEKEKGNPFNDISGDRSHWNYDGEDRLWVNDATYSFRAYFPKSQVVLEPASNSDSLLSVYDTQASQFDLMVASKSMVSRGENPVVLLFNHALAALKFNFKISSSGVTDNLTACWLENVEPEGFYTSSTLNFKNSIIWPKSSANSVGERIYYWKPLNPLPITSEGNSTAYTTYAASGNGDLYLKNDGWVLVIPQITPGPEALQLCFTTTTGGDAVYRVGVPAVELLSGSRYTFNVNISSTKIDVKLSIAQWNERDSSYEVDFNN